MQNIRQPEPKATSLIVAGGNADVRRECLALTRTEAESPHWPHISASHFYHKVHVKSSCFNYPDHFCAESLHKQVLFPIILFCFRGPVVQKF